MTPSLPDSTLAFMREGYPFISSRCDALGTDIFQSRLMFRPATFMRGAEAAALFYDGHHMTRQAAMPPSVQHLLQDKGSVQGLDGAAHAVRKHAFLSLMTPESLARLGDLFEEEWHAAMRRRADRRGITVLDTAREVLTRTVCRWSDVPLPEDQVARRTQELSLMIDQVARFGPGNWYAQWRRRGTEQWISGLVQDVRGGRLDPRPGTALEVFAHHREDGRLLPAEVAAVEIINVLRPTLAIANFVAFAALALDEHPQWRATFAAGDETDLEPFVQEVRRFYPFFPAIAGHVLEPFEFSGHRFSKGEWVFLDLYGTCHDRRLFEDPDSFRPERFRGWSWEEDPYTLIAQGAGRHESDHRCPGEWSTVELLKRAVRVLAASDTYLPTQDRTVPLNRFPSIPHSGVVLARRS